MTQSKDSIYASPLGEIKAFTFDRDVAQVFPDMIQRSVPGYSAIITAIGLLAGRFAKAGTNCYDLGCSLGAASVSMLAHIPPQCHVFAVDSSEAMITQCKQNLQFANNNHQVQCICADISDIKIENASVVVLNFTLQFIAKEVRQQLMTTIYQGLQPGGILILSEKLAFENDRQQQIQMDMHHQFKRMQGYSQLEISQKRTALENVLIPETLFEHQQRLQKAGFASCEVWFQYFNFASMLALK